MGYFPLNKESSLKNNRFERFLELCGTEQMYAPAASKVAPKIHASARPTRQARRVPIPRSKFAGKFSTVLIETWFASSLVVLFSAELLFAALHSDITNAEFKGVLLKRRVRSQCPAAFDSERSFKEK
jgi:hypothetical protein